MTSLTIIADAAEPPRVLELRTVHEGSGCFLVARLRLGDGSEIERDVEDHGTVFSVLLYDVVRGKALLVRQLRIPAFVAAGLATLVEAPAGRLEETARPLVRHERPSRNAV